MLHNLSQCLDDFGCSSLSVGRRTIGFILWSAILIVAASEILWFMMVFC